MILGCKSPSQPVRAPSSENRVPWTGRSDISFPRFKGSPPVWMKTRLRCNNALTRKGNNVAAADWRGGCTHLPRGHV
ncbi:UNVERIFIED_CONTAM: hypothetical protein FKN15_062612 [Acipenser sinensis]